MAVTFEPNTSLGREGPFETIIDGVCGKISHAEYREYCEEKLGDALRDEDRIFCASEDNSDEYISCFKEKAEEWGGKVDIAGREVPVFEFNRYSFAVSGLSQRPDYEQAVSDEKRRIVFEVVKYNFSNLANIIYEPIRDLEGIEEKGITSPDFFVRKMFDKINGKIAEEAEKAKTAKEEGREYEPELKPINWSIEAAGDTTLYKHTNNVLKEYVEFLKPIAIETLKAIKRAEPSKETVVNEAIDQINDYEFKYAYQSDDGIVHIESQPDLIATITQNIKSLFSNYYERMVSEIERNILSDDKKTPEDVSKVLSQLGKRLVAVKVKDGEGSSFNPALQQPTQEIDAIARGAVALSRELEGFAKEQEIEVPPILGESSFSAGLTVEGEYTNVAPNLASWLYIGPSLSYEPFKGHIFSLAGHFLYVAEAGPAFSASETLFLSDQNIDPTNLFLLVGLTLGGTHSVSDIFTLGWQTGMLDVRNRTEKKGSNRDVQGALSDMYHVASRALGGSLNATVVLSEDKGEKTKHALSLSVRSGHLYNPVLNADDYEFLKGTDGKWVTSFEAAYDYTSKSFLKALHLEVGHADGHDALDDKYVFETLLFTLFNLGSGFEIGLETYYNLTDFGHQFYGSGKIGWSTEGPWGSFNIYAVGGGGFGKRGFVVGPEGRTQAHGSDGSGSEDVTILDQGWSSVLLAKPTFNLSNWVKFSLWGFLGYGQSGRGGFTDGNFRGGLGAGLEIGAPK